MNGKSREDLWRRWIINLTRTFLYVSFFFLHPGILPHHYIFLCLQVNNTCWWMKESVLFHDIKVNFMIYTISSLLSTIAYSSYNFLLLLLLLQLHGRNYIRYYFHHFDHAVKDWRYSEWRRYTISSLSKIHRVHTINMYLRLMSPYVCIIMYVYRTVDIHSVSGRMDMFIAWYILYVDLHHVPNPNTDVSLYVNTFKHLFNGLGYS